MKTVAVVYTSMGNLVSTMKSQLSEALPDYRIVNIADDSLINDVIAAGRITPEVKARLFSYFSAASILKPEIIISACSSVGAIAEEYSERSEVPVLRIDHAMIVKALEAGDRIGVLASLGTTMEPTKDYISRLAEEAGRKAELTGMVAEGAYEANAKGDKETHDRLLLQTAEKMKGKVDVVLLAQGSMAKMEGPIHELLGIPVYSSPRLCIEEVVRILKG